MSIYRFERRIWLALEGPHGIKNLEEIHPHNKEKLLEYATYLKASDRSLPRQDKLLRTLMKFAVLLGDTPFKKATKKDIVDVLAKYQNSRGKPLSQHTRSDFKKIIKYFYAWLYEIEDPRHEGYPKAVKWIHPKEPKSKLEASDLLTPLEVKKLIAATTDLRMKALIAVCYECGLRIGEALKLKIRNVDLQEQCASLTVTGKTGPRQAYSIESLPLLMQWLDQHPDRKNSEAWLWTDNTKPLSYDHARFMLQECRKKAKIHKRIYWHLFRHSSATRNAEMGESYLREIYGWSKSSDEPGTYIHLSGEAVKKALLTKHGIRQETEKATLLTCPRCGTPNQLDASICTRCRSVLKLETIFSISQLKDELNQLRFEIVKWNQFINHFMPRTGKLFRKKHGLKQK